MGFHPAKLSEKRLNEAGIFAYSSLSKYTKFNQHLPVHVPIKPYRRW